MCVATFNTASFYLVTIPKNKKELYEQSSKTAFYFGQKKNPSQ